jgi:uncharacterized damage-inducible protein DinB
VSEPTELANYRLYLDHFRATLERKCADLTPEQLAARSVPPSPMSLLGLLRHVARVEHFWFQMVLRGHDEPEPFEDGDGGFADVEPTEAAVRVARTLWQREVERADEWLGTQSDATLAEEVTLRGGTQFASKRDILVHMIEEYARHSGHADLLRECIDGRTGQ